MQRGFATAALVVVGLVLVKDGTAGTFIQNVGTALSTLAKGVKPIATAA